MINGPMAEAQNDFATLEDVDHGTFVRFIEWAHKGYYAAADCTILAESHVPETTGSCTDSERVIDSDRDSPPEGHSEPAPAECQEPEGAVVAADLNVSSWAEYGGSASRSKKKKFKVGLLNAYPPSRPTTREDLIQEFISRRPVERKTAIAIPPPRKNQNSNEVYSEVFLSHARLYVFAEKYDIEPLRMLALDELHATLVVATYTLYAERTGDIVELLRYVYANTGEPREGVEDMRTLMTLYLGQAMDKLMKDPNFAKLMVEDRGDLPPLLGDFMKMVAKRIS